jgi:hypothetical protein
VAPYAPVTVTPVFSTTGESVGDVADVGSELVDELADVSLVEAEWPELDEHAPSASDPATSRTMSATEPREPLYTGIPSVSSSVVIDDQPNPRYIGDRAMATKN